MIEWIIWGEGGFKPEKLVSKKFKNNRSTCEAGGKKQNENNFQK